MPAPIPEIRITRQSDSSIPLDDTIARLRGQTFVDLESEKGVTDVDRRWASFSGDPRRLDDGDLFFGLSRPDMYGSVAVVTERLRRHLGFAPQTALEFQTFPLSPTMQLAMVVVTPKTAKPDASPMIMATGFAHSSALYVQSMQKLADQLGSKVILFDQPGNGGSQSSDTVNQSHFYHALKTAIRLHVPEGGQYYVTAHSLGSSGAYQLFRDIQNGKSPVGKRNLLRMMLVNPIPTRDQELAGNGKMSRPFLWAELGSLTAHGFTAMRAKSLHRFNGTSPESTREHTVPHIMREVVPISIFGMISTLGNLDASDPLDAIGNDPRLAVVLGRHDQLMNWDVGAFAGKRGYHVIDADHGGFLIDATARDADIQKFANILTQSPALQTPVATRGSLYRRLDGAVRLGLMSEFRSSSGLLVPEISVRTGLAPIAASGLYWGAAIYAEAGFQFAASRPALSPQAHTYIGLEGLRIPVDARVGARWGIDFMDTSEQPFVSGLTAMLGTNLARIVDIEAQARFGFDGQFQGALAGLRLRLL